MLPISDIQTAGPDNIIPLLILGLIWWLSKRADKKSRRKEAPPRPVQPVTQPVEVAEEEFYPFDVFRHSAELRQEKPEPIELGREETPELFSVLKETAEPSLILEPEVAAIQPREVEEPSVAAPYPVRPVARRTNLQKAVIWAEILGKPVAFKE